jgi:hypothetical protein
MKGKVFESAEPIDKLNLYLDPRSKTIVASYDILNQKKGITSLDQIYNWPVYSLNTHFEAQRLAEQGKADEDGLYHAFLDTETEEIAKKYKSDVISGGDARYAALRSEVNKSVNIINVWTELQGRRDRKYAAKNLAKEIAVNNLVISVDKVLKPTGLTQIDEGGLTEAKILQYSRQTFTANKYGMKYVMHEEARLKNVHNVLQDAIQVAANKIEQRASFDTIIAANTLSTLPTLGSWDSFVASTSRSTNNPLTDIGIAQLNIEGTAVGARLTRIGLHQITLAAFLANSNVRGIAPVEPVKYDFEPGTGVLPGVPGIGLVKDNAIQEGYVYFVDTETEDATIHYYQGPQRMGSAHDEETGDDKYFIIDYHLAQVVQTQTGFIMTNGLASLIQWS